MVLENRSLPDLLGTQDNLAQRLPGLPSAEVPVKPGERSGGHTLCICPETTFSGGPSAAEVEACRVASGGITHRMIEAIDLGLFAKEVQEEMRARRG